MRLKLRGFGTDAEGIRLQGDPRSPEPTYTILKFPGGELSVTRLTEGAGPYECWVHLTLDRPEPADPGPRGVLVDARVDVHGRHVNEVPAGILEDPDLYHVAFRVRQEPAIGEGQGVTP